MNRNLRFSDILQDLAKLSNTAFRSSTGASTLILYSGLKGKNRTFAKNAVESAPTAAFSIYQTEAGKYLEDLDLYAPDSGFGSDEAMQLWAFASQRLVENARGNVETYVIDAAHNWVFRNTELYAVLANPHVTSINGVPCERLMGLGDPRAIYQAVCQSELDRDEALLAHDRDPALQQSIDDRRAAFEKWQATNDGMTPKIFAEQQRADEELVKLMARMRANEFALTEEELIEAQIEAEMDQVENYDFDPEIGLSDENEI